MSQTNIFKWAVLGPGRIAERFAGGLSAIDDAQLYAVASRDSKRAEAFATKFGATKHYDSYDVLLADPEIDAVYVATPHRFHFEQAKQCLLAGKPVLCEKPLTVNAEQSQELIEIAQNQNVFLMEAMWTRYLPIYNVIREWIDQGAIGEVENCLSSFGFCVPRDLEDRLYNESLAGGVLLDMGVYNIAISQWVMGGNPTEFRAAGRVGETNVDEQVAVTMKYGNYKTSQFTASIIAQQSNEFVIHGKKGFIRIHAMFWDCVKATLVNANGEVTETREFDATGFEYETREAMGCIREGKIESDTMPHADTLANMELMDSIRAEIGLRYSFEE